MIRLDPKELQGMFPDMPEGFAERTGRMLQALVSSKEEKHMKRISLRTTLIAAVLVLSMMTTALALSRPAILDWLLGNGTAGTELTQIAQEVSAEATADGITARITGVVYDGRSFAFSYELENADPDQAALVALCGDLTLNGQTIRLMAYVDDAPDTTLVPSLHLDALPVRRNPVSGGAWSQKLTEGLSGQAVCDVTFIIYRPQKAFAYLCTPDSMLRDAVITDADALAEVADVRATLERFDNAVIVEGEWEDVDRLVREGYTVIGDAEELSNLTETARITVHFTFDADRVIAYDLTPAEAIDLPDATVQISQFLLTPLRTQFCVDVLPAQNTQEAANALADKLGAYALTDENGAPLAFAAMDGMAVEFPDVQCIDGQWLCRYREERPGVEAFPQSVGFVTKVGELFRLTMK